MGMNMEYLSEEAYVRYLLAAYCMPTLGKLKPSSLVSIYKLRQQSNSLIINPKQFDRSLLLHVVEKETQLFDCSYYIFYENQNILQLFIYRKDLLQSIMNETEQHNFLVSYGYETNNIGMVLDKMKTKFELFHAEAVFGKPCCFPHEIGILLGYPLADVEAFIRYYGKNYILSGYWKVYYHPQKAVKIFEEYRAISKYAVHAMMSGKDMMETVNSYNRCNYYYFNE